MDKYEILLTEIINKLNNLENTIDALCDKNNIKLELCDYCKNKTKIFKYDENKNITKDEAIFNGSCHNPRTMKFRFNKNICLRCYENKNKINS